MNQMSRWKEIGLVTGREYSTMLLKKATIISTVIMMVLSVGVILVSHFFLSGVFESLASTRVGIDHPKALPALTSPGLEVVEIPRSGAEAALNGEADVDISAYIDTSTAPITVLVKEDLRPSVQRSITEAATTQATRDFLDHSGIDPDAWTRTVEQATPQVVFIDSAAGQGQGQFGLAFISAIALFVIVIASGASIAMGVVQEKQSRIVEILLATVRPTSLLAGKIIGIVAAQLTSWLLIGVAAGIASAAVGSVPVLPGTGLSAFVLWAVLWTLLGTAFYSMMYAAAGSMVSHQEDMGSMSGILMLPIFVGYFIGVTVVPNAPASLLAKVLSYIPFTAPFVVPGRVALNAMSGLEMVISVVVMVAVLPVVIWLSAKIYLHSIWIVGKKVKLRTALGLG